jgi:alkanesulfonate monooxygenase SsuD/methylene tetrahydromethanopterin reductase-like flavin-dependent oxidoreductase (luciferase family)
MAVIAKINVKPLMIPTVSLDLTLQGAREFMRLRSEAGLAPTDTKLALWIYCAESESEARSGAERYMREYADSALRHYEMTGTHFDDISGYEGYAQRAAALRSDPTPFLDGFFARHPWGTPEMVVEKISELAEQFGTSEIMGVFRYGGMGSAEATRSMVLFAEQALPEIQRLNPAPMSLSSVA